MKLHIPFRLRKALLACLAAVSSALPSTLSFSFLCANTLVVFTLVQQVKADPGESADDPITTRDQFWMLEADNEGDEARNRAGVDWYINVASSGSNPFYWGDANTKSDTISANLILQQSLVVNQGFSNSTITFAGNIIGDNVNLEQQFGGAYTWVFNGNLSRLTGNIIHRGGGTLAITFGQNAVANGGSIMREGSGALNLTLNGQVMYNATIGVTNLTVNGNVRFDRQSQRITVGNNLTMSAGGSVIFNGGNQQITVANDLTMPTGGNMVIGQSTTSLSVGRDGTVTGLSGGGNLNVGRNLRLDEDLNGFSGNIDVRGDLTLGGDFYTGVTIGIGGDIELDSSSTNLVGCNITSTSTNGEIVVKSLTSLSFSEGNKIDGFNITVERNASVVINGGNTFGDNVSFTIRGEGVLNLGGNSLGEVSITVEEGGEVIGVGETLALTEGSVLRVGKRSWYDGGEKSYSILDYAEGVKKGSLKVSGDGGGKLVLALSEDVIGRTTGEEFALRNIWLADAEIQIEDGLFRVKADGGVGYLYYVETEVKDGNTVLHLHGSRKEVWNASIQGDIDSLAWQSPEWSEEGGAGEHKEWKMVNVDRAMSVTVKGKPEDAARLKLNLLTGTEDLTISSERENATVVLHNDEDVVSDEDHKYTVDPNTEMKGNITVKGGDVNFEKTGRSRLTISGNLVARESSLIVSGGTLILQGGNSALRTIGELAEESNMQLDGKLMLLGDTTLKGGGTLSGSGELAMDGEKTLDVVEFGGVRSNVTVNLDEDGSKLNLGGNTGVQFGGLRNKGGKATIDLGKDGELVLAGGKQGKQESYSGALVGSGTITVCDNSEQTFIGTGNEEIDLVADWEGGLHLQGESKYNNILVKQGRNELNHDGYGALYIECTRGGDENSHITAKGDITLGDGTTTYLQLSMRQGLSEETSPLLTAEGALNVGSLAKLDISLTGNGVDLTPNEELRVPLMQGSYFNGEYKGGAFAADHLHYDPLLDVYYENVQVEFENEGHQVVLTGNQRKESPLKEVAKTGNSAAGSDLLWNRKDDPELRNISSALYKTFCGIIELSRSNPEATRKALSAVAGSSAAAIGSAQKEAMRTQMGRMRDRATQLGLAGGYSYDNLPYWHAWVEGVGSYNKLSEDGDESGFTLSSWGGTLGVDVDLSEHTAVGIGLTALRGNLKTNGADTGNGDLDSYYVSALLRTQRRRAAHTVVASIGTDDAELERSVSYGNGSYNTKGSTSGESFGLLYEFTYDLPGNAEGSALLQPLFTASVMHGSMKEYDETGADGLPLHVDKQDWTTTTLGVGLRWMCTIGENVLNRSVVFEARGAVLQDIGDTQGKVRAGLMEAPELLREVKSAEVGSTAVQLGIGVRAPMSDRVQVLFNTGAELRSGMTSWNIAAGIRYDF